MAQQNLLTIGEIYKPVSASELLMAVRTREEMEAARLQNRLRYEKGQDDAEYNRGWSGFFTGEQGAEGDQPTQTGQASGPFGVPGLAPGTPSAPGQSQTSLPPPLPKTPATGPQRNLTGPVGYRSQDVDKEAEVIMKSLEKIESGGKVDARNPDGSVGVLQYQPATWDRYSREYNEEAFGGSGPLPNTPQNQRLVGQFKVKKWLSQGYAPQQIAAMWNGGEGNADWRGKKGINPNTGVAYDMPTYVEGRFLPEYLKRMEMEGMGRVTPGPEAGTTARGTTGVPSPTVDNSMSPAYIRGRMTAALVPFNSGLQKALSTNNQSTLTAYLDYVDANAPYLKKVTSFYRGLQINESDGEVSGTLPGGTVSPQLYTEWADRIPPELQPIFSEAMAKKLPLKFTLDGDRNVKKAELVKDIEVGMNKYGLAKQAVQEAKRARGDTSLVTATEIEDHLLDEQMGPIDPDALRKDAEFYGQTGQLPPNIGFGTSANRYKQKVRNEWSKLARESGLGDIPLALRSARYKSTRENLAKTENILNMTRNYEKTVEEYLPILEEQFDKVKVNKIRAIGDLEYKILNNLIGDPDARVLYGTLYETLVDYGKVVTGNFSIAGLTDTARVEGQKLLDAADNPESRKKILANFRTMMAKRSKALIDTSEEILDRGGLTNIKRPGEVGESSSRKGKGDIPQDKIDMYLGRAQGNLKKAKQMARDDGWDIK
jgi:hypothetical protein